MNSRHVIARQIRAKARAERLEKGRVAGRLPAKELATGAYHGESRLRRASQMAVRTMTLVILTLAGVYWYLHGSPFVLAMSPYDMATMGRTLVVPASDRFVNDRFDIGGIRLGMTPSMVRRIHPEAKLIEGRSGRQVLTVSTKRGKLFAWMDENDRPVEVDGKFVMEERQRIYRLRLDEVFSNLTEQDLMRLYGRAYGRPLEATCKRNQLGDTPRCTYRWWGGDGIELTATLKQKVDAKGQRYVLLTTIATNTQKIGKLAGVPLTRMPPAT